MENGDVKTIRWRDTDIQATVVGFRRLDDHTAVYRLDIPGYGETQEYLCGEDDLAEFWKLQSNFPAEYRGKQLRDFKWSAYPETDTRKIRDITQAFVKDFKKFNDNGIGLFICSRTKGSGKTLLACVLANEVIDQYKIGVKFVNAVDYTERMKNKEDLSRVRDCGILILDDVGAEGTREWNVSMMRDLINHRYQEHLLTIFTSNRSWDSTHPDDLVHSRIYGMSIPIPLPEISVRERKADERIKEFLERVL